MIQDGAISTGLGSGGAMNIWPGCS